VFVYGRVRPRGRCDGKSVAGDFTNASREYSTAAGIFDNLATEQLPKWIAKGNNVDEASLPVECMPSMASALVQLFMANGQQMAIATVLLKDGTPNYSLVAKLCLGVAEQLEAFLAEVRRAGDALSRLDPDFLTLLSLQIAVQNALSLYFQARKLWEDDEFGLAISLMREAGLALKERSHNAAKGVPSVSTGVLKPLADDMKDLRHHFAIILGAYEKDNSSVYFMNVPAKVPAAKKLSEGLKMNKKMEFKLQEAEPVLLAVPAKRGGHTRTDSDLARELQEKLNAGLS
jgi:BRO1-like domain